jgi:hypothetical protein
MKEQIIGLLWNFINERPGLDFRDYGDAKLYRAELRQIGKDLRHARALLNAVERSGMVSGEWLHESLTKGGRLSIKRNDKSSALELTFLAVQCYSTEYRKAVCSVLASCLLSAERKAFPRLTCDELRARFRRRFGRGIQGAWFN